MILAIRISGIVNMPRDREEILFRLRLRRKYSAVLLKDTPESRKILKLIRNCVAYGIIDKNLLVKLIELRGKSLKGKIDARKTAEELDKKEPEELGLKPFFRLHPPRKGIESKRHFGVGKGVLGDNKEKINNLLERML